MTCDLCGKDGHDRSIHLPTATRARAKGAHLICPQCQKAGHVSVRREKRKGVISGGKATGAIMTGGLSLFATGLSRMSKVDAHTCSNCGHRWDRPA